MPKLNCWEFKRCGREPGGARVHELGVCPSSTESRLDGVHEGANAGRSCWVVGGTMCNGKRQGSFGQKALDCGKCDFPTLVRREEGQDFRTTPGLLSQLLGP